MHNGDEVDISKTCAQCGAEGVTTTTEEDVFPYGVDGPGQVMLRATVPVRHCAACGFDYTDEEGADARDAAVQRHLASAKRIVNLPPQDGIAPAKAFTLLSEALSLACSDASVSGLELVRFEEGDAIAEVLDYSQRFPKTGLTVSACEIEGKSIARRLFTPGYNLTWIGPGPNDPQDGDDSVEVGEFYRAADVAVAIVMEMVAARMRMGAERRAYRSVANEAILGGAL